MVGDGEGFAVSAIEPFEIKFLFDGEPALLTEKSVQMDRSVGRGNAVLG